MANLEQCPECSSPWVRAEQGYLETLVGYYSPPGHDHDDNCRRRYYKCANGHGRSVSLRRTCPTCNWKGKLTCFCHEGEKVEKWPSFEQGGKHAS